MSLGDKRVLAKYSRLAPIDMAHFVLHGKWRLLPAISLASLPCPFLFEYASCHLAERRPQIAFWRSASLICQDFCILPGPAYRRVTRERAPPPLKWNACGANFTVCQVQSTRSTLSDAMITATVASLTAKLTLHQHQVALTAAHSFFLAKFSRFHWQVFIVILCFSHLSEMRVLKTNDRQFSAVCF